MNDDGNDENKLGTLIVTVAVSILLIIAFIPAMLAGI